MNDQAAHRADVRIDLAAIRHNVGTLSDRARRSGARTMAVLKSDGYGHGASAVASAALRSGAEWLGVASIAEALQLRADGVEAPVLCWLYLREDDVAAAVSAGVDLSVSSSRELNAVVEAVGAVGGPARIHLKIDTGLHRNGALPEDWGRLVEEAAKAEADGSVEVFAVWSHLACADEPGHPSIDMQAQRFRLAHQQAVDAGLRPLRHLANSAALLTRPDLHFDMVRPGIALYGLDPVPQAGAHDLRPAMTFRSTVVLTKRIQAGEAVSYGHVWVAPAETNLALVPVGYADGVPRSLSGRMSVWLRGKRRPVVGKVCMDQLVVCCDDDEVEEGDEVVLFGPGDDGEPTVAEWAREVGTIHYEIVTGMYRPRVSRTLVAEEAA
ncbi:MULTISPECIES: alanine racemase [unclassified Actinopolyspora]|uniref:alanine racemase n=1 Tax=unclassified Actinopolyspora TaxID=2639451 RepID=UPI0013F665E2|nr:MULTISPECIES: alanine racemase [unclassified Actinopolyspora]NHD16652.1 alanine racemase [Actinopolyspora sp. BKK2]NHE75485.1 alanine racemase [Actinopolyspora sp. BKK1]